MVQLAYEGDLDGMKTLIEENKVCIDSLDAFGRWLLFL